MLDSSTPALPVPGQPYSHHSIDPGELVRFDGVEACLQFQGSSGGAAIVERAFDFRKPPMVDKASCPYGLAEVGLLFTRRVQADFVGALHACILRSSIRIV